MVRVKSRHCPLEMEVSHTPKIALTLGEVVRRAGYYSGRRELRMPSFSISQVNK